MAEGLNSNGAEPVYGPAATGNEPPSHAAQPQPQTGPIPPPVTDAPEPPYTAPYPPYPSDLPPTYGIAPNVAAGLAYFTVVPAILFLLIEPYRAHPLVRFHSWQSVFFFLVVAAAKAVLGVAGAILPALFIVLLSSLLSLVLLAGWLMAVIQAFSGKRTQLPGIGPLAEKTAA